MKSLILLLAAVTLPAAAAAQDQRLARRLDPAVHAQVVALLDSARAADLPLEPLVDRALEGASKGAPGPLIVNAVRKLAADLAAAREALRGGAPAELEAGASALRAGVTRSALSSLRQTRPRQTLTVPLAVLADLVARGVPADSATAFVLAIAAASDEQLVAFQRNVERDIALGAPPLAAAAVRVNSTGLADQNQPPGENPASPPAPRKP